MARVLAVGSMYPPQHAGGYELVWARMMADLRRAGHSVRVLTSDLRINDAPDEELDVYRELRRYWDGDRPREFSASERFRIERINARTLNRHLGDFRPGLVSFWGMGGISTSLIEHVRRAGLPGVGYVADHWLSANPPSDQWLRSWVNRPRLGRFISALSGIPTSTDPGVGVKWVFISEYLRRSALGGRWDLPDTRVVAAGIDDTVFVPRPESPAWRWRLLYVGRVDPVKGIDTLLRALSVLPDAATLIVDGPVTNDTYLAELRQLTVELGLTARVEFQQSATPRRLADVYASADALVFPVAWDEPWGLVPLEAMAVGVPVIATGTGGSAEYLTHDGNSRLFPAGDFRALAQALVTLSVDPELRQQLVRNGFVTADRYTGAACTTELRLIHEQVAGE